MLRNHKFVSCYMVVMSLWIAPAVAQTSEEVQKIKDALPQSATAKPASNRQVAPGYLEAGAKPVTSNALEKQEEALDAAEAGLKDYDYGKAEPASAIFDSVARGTTDAPNVRRAFVARLVAVATDPQYSIAARELTLRRIPYTADEADVSGLFPLLKDSEPKIAEMTRYALAPIAGRSISKAFRETAASSTNENLTVGLLNALGSRKDDESVALLAESANNPSAAIASAAISALGNIGTPASAAELRKLFSSAGENSKGPIGSALVECAGELAANGRPEDARSIYKALLEEKGSHEFRLAAFTGNATLSPNPAETALETLLGADTQLHSAAGTFLTASKDPTLNQKIAAAMEGQESETQTALLGIAKARQATEVIEPARELLSSETSGTKEAAIVALGTIGNESVLPDLLQIAADRSDEFREQARTSIDQLWNEGVDEQLIEFVDPHRGRNQTKASSLLTAEAILALGRRQVTAAVPVLLENAKIRQDDTLKAESYNVLTRLARAEDGKVLLEMNYRITSPKVRAKADMALLAAIRKMEPAESQSAFLVEAIEPAPSGEARVSILKLLGKLGGENPYRALKAYLTSEDETIQDAVVRALADFPTPEPIHDLLAIAGNESAGQVHRVLALRGAARMLSLDAQRKHSETIQLAKKMLDLAATDEDRTHVIASLADVKQPGIIELIEPSLGTETLAPETRAAILKLAADVWMFSPKETSETLKRISEAGLTDEQEEALAKIADHMAKLPSAVAGWQASGPYSDPAVQNVEQLLTHKFDPEAQGTDSAEWKPVSVVGGNSENAETVDLVKAFGGAKNSAGYLRAFLIAETETTAALRVGSDDAIQIWMDGEKAFSAPRKRSYRKAEDAVTVALKQGSNELLLKLAHDDAPWRASVYIETPEGGALPGVTARAFPRAAE